MSYRIPLEVGLFSVTPRGPGTQGLRRESAATVRPDSFPGILAAGEAVADGWGVRLEQAKMSEAVFANAALSARVHNSQAQCNPPISKSSAARAQGFSVGVYRK
jgi:hypothetical protein